MSREPYDPQLHQIDVLVDIAEALERIATALEAQVEIQKVPSADTDALLRYMASARAPEAQS